MLICYKTQPNQSLCVFQTDFDGKMESFFIFLNVFTKHLHYEQDAAKADFKRDTAGLNAEFSFFLEDLPNVK